jgi:hypothetical protein
LSGTMPTATTKRMTMIARWVRPGLWIGVVAALAGCGATDAYVYKKDEFDRTAKTFNKEPQDRDEVTICYNDFRTPEKRVADMAEQECAKFLKTARRENEVFGDCPLLTPIEARFACIKAEQ